MKKDEEIQRRRPKQQRAIEKYEAVLDACSQLLMDKGYAKTSMLELSLASDVAVPTIYQYFTNKEEIFQVWFERLSLQVFESLNSLEVGRAQQGLVESFMERALSVIVSQRKSAQALLNELPSTLSSNMIASLEKQTLTFVEGLGLRELSTKEIDQGRLLILIRLMIGYLLQIILNRDREPDIAEEAQELSNIVKSYLGVDV